MNERATPKNPAFTIAGARKAIATNSTPVLVATIAATNILRIVGNLVLTRLLAPEAFGIVGVLSSVTVILQMATDMGYHAYIVRSREAGDRRFLDVIWTIRLARAAILTIVMFAGAGALAAAFAKPELETPIMAAAFLFLFEGARSLNPIVAERARRVSYVTIIEFAAFLLQMAITIAAAFVLKSFWAIIVGMYAGAAIATVFSYTLYPGGFHALTWDRRVGAELWRFARVVVLSSAITLVLSQADKIFIGRTLSLEEFGLYMLAVNLTAAALGLIRTYVIRVLFPLFAETARDAADKLAKTYYASRRRMTLVLAFLLGGGVGGGQLIVKILFDERYLGAGVFVSLLCLAPLFSLMTLPAEQLLIVLGRIRSALEANIARFAWIIVAAPLGLHFYGVVGMVAAFALIEFAAAIYWQARLRRTGYFDWREEAAPLAVALVGAFIGYGASRLADYLIATGALPAF
ncbi:MAG: oligosaccharide flippase family protein [Parvularculaceae bacterium]